MEGKLGLGFGPDPGRDASGPPFSVTGPQTIALDDARQGIASFVVTNTSGRDVTVRLLPQPLNGAAAEWLSLAGPIERPLGLSSTLTAEVRVAVPPTVASGQYALRLDAVVEEAPDRLTNGQSVDFTVPAPVKKAFPRWILAVVAAALVIIVIGTWVILRLNRGPETPVVVTQPTVQTRAEIGATLTLHPGTWTPHVTLLHRWQSCPGNADATHTEDCTDITMTQGTSTSTAEGDTFVVGPEQEGKRIRVVEVAIVGDLTTAKTSDLASLLKATAYSALTDAVPPAPPKTVPIPKGLAGLPLSQAKAALAAAQLQSLWAPIQQAGPSCDPVVLNTAPLEGTPVPVGTTVALITLATPRNVFCFVPNDKVLDRSFPLSSLVAKAP